MAGSKVFQIFLLISFMIFSTHALTLFLTDGKGTSNSTSCLKCEARFSSHFERTKLVYDGCFIDNITYRAGAATTKVIVYINDKTVLESTALLNQPKCLAKRLKLADDLKVHGYELLYLGVSGFRHGQKRIVSEILHNSIKSHQGQSDIEINTIAADGFDKICDLKRYEENVGVLEWNVESRIVHLHE